jgi:uncharacterized protein YciI
MKPMIIYSQGINWKEDISLHDQPFIPEHAVYAQSLYDAGLALMGGPFADHSGGMILLQVESIEHAIEIAENDPAVKNGIFIYQVKSWNDILNHYENRNPKFYQEYLDFKHKYQRELNII